MRRLGDASGQVLPLAVMLMTALLLMAAFVVDIGKAYLVQRQLQASVDAAALAAAQQLPDASAATTAATAYGPGATGKNAVKTAATVSTTVTMRCVASAPGCNPGANAYNAVHVKANADVDTGFARIIGIDKLNVKVSATACSPCSAKPLDIMIILDRTGSMCDKPGDDRAANRCADLDKARGAIQTFLSLMDPKLDRVGLAVSPPAVGPSAGGGDTPSNVCASPVSSNRWFGYDAWAPYWETGPGSGYRSQDRAFYVVSSLTDDDVDNDPSDDYVVKDGNGYAILNPASGLVQTVACVKANGSTSYSMAIVEAEHELAIHGRADVQDVIVFFTDGGANVTQETAGTHWNGSPPWDSRPCGSGVYASDRLPSSTLVYTIGYDLDNQESSTQRCNTPNSDGHSNFSNPKEVCQWWGCTPQAALQAIASQPDNFHYTANPDTFKTIFTRIAADLQRPASRLIDDGTA